MTIRDVLNKQAADKTPMRDLLADGLSLSDAMEAKDKERTERRASNKAEGAEAGCPIAKALLTKLEDD